MTTPPMVTIWPSYTNQEDAMTTPTPSDYWINECIKIAASAGNLDAAENARRDLAALKAELASVKAERDALKERIWQIRVELGALFTMLPNEVPGLAMEVCERDADRQCLFRAFELAAHKEGA